MAIEQAQTLIRKISQQSGRLEDEVKSLVAAKQAKFAGLLTEVGALIMVAKELGVQIETEIKASTKIKELSTGQNNIDIVGRIKQVFPEKEFEKNGKKGKLRSLILTDETGEIRATLWNKDVDKFTEINLAKGDAVKLVNCSVTEWNGTKQLNMNYNSSIAKEQNCEIAHVVKIQNLSDLDPGMNDVTVKVTVKKIFPSKNFERDERQGKVMNFIISEGMEEIRATAWNEMVDKVEEIGEGELVRIDGAYVKEGMSGIELHLGNYASINPEKGK